MLSEQISGAGDAGHPDSRAQEVEENKRPPAHAKDAGQRSGENAQTEDEAGKENGGRSVAGKHVLAAFQRCRRNSEDPSIAIEQRAPAIVADGIAQVVAERCGARGNHDDPSEMEPMLGIGQKTCQQERGLTGHRNAGVLAEQCQSHGPVTVGGDEFAQRVKNRGAHEKQVLSCQLSVLSQPRSSENLELGTENGAPVRKSTSARLKSSGVSS